LCPSDLERLRSNHCHPGTLRQSIPGQERPVKPDVLQLRAGMSVERSFEKATRDPLPVSGVLLTCEGNNLSLAKAAE
jgi:hypothetical protein